MNDSINLIGILGFKGSGKDTAAQILIESGYRKFAFADRLKDTIANIFNWDREMMEGTTPASRKWREENDPWWAAKMEVDYFSPRIAMTAIGNDILKKFSPDIWVYSLENQLTQHQNSNVVVTDCRFENECDMIKRMGGILIRIDRGAEPDFCQLSNLINSQDGAYNEYLTNRLAVEFPQVHESEYAWNHIPVNYRIANDGTIEELHEKVHAVMELVHGR